MDLAVRDGLVLVGEQVERADIGIESGEITVIGDVPRADREVDATGSLVLPGLVNAHTHSPMALLRGYADDLPLQRWLEDRIWPIEAELEPEDIAAGARLAALEMIRSGTTAFADMYFGMEEVAAAVDDAGLRALLGYGVITVDRGEDAAAAEIDQAVAFADEYDGAAGGRIRTMLTPHAPYTCDDWVLESLAEQAREGGRPLHLHLNETAGEVEELTERTGRRPAEHLEGLGCWDGHAFVAHAVHVDETDREQLAAGDVGVAHCPAANMKLATGVAPIPALLEAGVDVALGTDGPASNNTLDMFSEMRHAALLAKVHHGDASLLPAGDVIEMATGAGARLLGLSTGRIALGHRADLAILDLEAPHLTPDHDLRSHVVYAAGGADVHTTIVDGEVLMEDHTVNTLDADRVLADARKRASAVVERVENA